MGGIQTVPTIPFLRNHFDPNRFNSNGVSTGEAGFQFEVEKPEGNPLANHVVDLRSYDFSSAGDEYVDIGERFHTAIAQFEQARDSVELKLMRSLNEILDVHDGELTVSSVANTQTYYLDSQSTHSKLRIDVSIGEFGISQIVVRSQRLVEGTDSDLIRTAEMVFSFPGDGTSKFEGGFELDRLYDGSVRRYAQALNVDGVIDEGEIRQTDTDSHFDEGTQIVGPDTFELVSDDVGHWQEK